jgi:hypothetical protein
LPSRITAHSARLLNHPCCSLSAPAFSATKSCTSAFNLRCLGASLQAARSSAFEQCPGFIACFFWLLATWFGSATAAFSVLQDIRARDSSRRPSANSARSTVQSPGAWQVFANPRSRKNLVPSWHVRPACRAGFRTDRRLFPITGPI